MSRPTVVSLGLASFGAVTHGVTSPHWPWISSLTKP